MLSMPSLVEYASDIFRGIDMPQIDAAHMEDAESYWKDWNVTSWSTPWLQLFGKKLRLMLLQQVPTLIEDISENLDVEYPSSYSSLFSSISSHQARGLKDFPRSCRYHQTYGDRLLSIMLLHMQELLVKEKYPRKLLVCESHTPLWKYAERNAILHDFMRTIDLLPSRRSEHSGGDMCESMLLVLVQRNQAHLAFLIVLFIVCMLIDAQCTNRDARFRTTCT